MSNKLRGGIPPGGVDLSLDITLNDSSTGAGKTGVAHTSVTAYYYRQGAASAVQITMASLGSNNAAHSDGGWREIDATNMPGTYRFDVTDAFWATGADWVKLNLRVSGADEVNLMFALDPFNVDASGNVKLQATTHTSAVIPTVTTLTGHTPQTGDNFAIVNSATFGNAKLVRSTTPANTLDISATGEVGLDGTTLVLTSTERDAIAAALWASTPASESYAADGVLPNLGQFLLMIMQRQNEFVKSGVTITVKKLDGSTTAATFTLDNATTPNSITRSS